VTPASLGWQGNRTSQNSHKLADASSRRHAAVPRSCRVPCNAGVFVLHMPQGLLLASRSWSFGPCAWPQRARLPAALQVAPLSARYSGLSHVQSVHSLLRHTRPHTKTHTHKHTHTLTHTRTRHARPIPTPLPTPTLDAISIPSVHSPSTPTHTPTLTPTPLLYRSPLAGEEG
jgi:hypothetical protein